jgi:hypothetical protein
MEGWLLTAERAAHAAKAGFQPAADLRLSIFDCRLSICEVPPWWRLNNTLIKVRNGAMTDPKSAHWLIATSMESCKSQIENRQSKIENGPMIRWPDHHGLPLYFRNKRG